MSLADFLTVTLPSDVCEEAPKLLEAGHVVCLEEVEGLAMSYVEEEGD